VEDAGYLRLNNLQIGYTVPTIEAIGLKNLRVYTGASNLFTITPYSGLDPEDDNYPMPRTFFLGLNMRF
jgi:outer membrane receptor protein involved in Fe transport